MKTATLILPEQRTILKQVSWKTFINLLKDLGDKRAVRLYYDQGVLEIRRQGDKGTIFPSFCLLPPAFLPSIVYW